jgi:ATP-dependent DNA ligase
MKIELYKSTPTGVRYWSVEPDYEWGFINIVHGKLNGALQSKTEEVEENQSGRTIEEQIDLRMESRASSKRDIGYRESIEKAKAAEGNNTLGYHRPMLATRLDRINHVNYNNMYSQMKYDGHRCMVTMTTTGLIAYSRNGKKISTIDHILAGIKIPVGCTIDGELYCHGVPLQTITSWAKKLQPNTQKLEYVVYDVVSDEGYRDRYTFLKNIRFGKHARRAPTDKTVLEEGLPTLLKSVVAFGYEGLILRDLSMPYEIGKRSKGLIKVKQFMDAEFKVIDIISSVEGWARLVCITNDGMEFKVSSPGTIHQKTQVLHRKNEFIGEFVSVTFANFTKDGKPFHPIAERWRQDL